MHAYPSTTMRSRRYHQQLKVQKVPDHHQVKHIFWSDMSDMMLCQHAGILTDTLRKNLRFLKKLFKICIKLAKWISSYFTSSVHDIVQLRICRNVFH